MLSNASGKSGETRREGLLVPTWKPSCGRLLGWGSLAPDSQVWQVSRKVKRECTQLFSGSGCVKERGGELTAFSSTFSFRGWVPESTVALSS